MQILSYLPVEFIKYFWEKMDIWKKIRYFLAFVNKKILANLIPPFG